MFKKEALPFAAGFCMCLGIFGISYLMYLETEQRFDPADHPRSQSFEATAYMKDGWMTKVRLTVRTKEDLYTPFMKMQGREFINRVAAQYTSEQFDEMSLKFKEDTVRYLALPCSSRFEHVSTTVPE